MELNIDSTLMIIIILLLVLIVGLFAVSIILALNYLKNNKNNVQDIPEKSEKEKVNLEGIGLCKNHEEKTSVGICAFCEEEFCSECLKQIESVSLCPEHFGLYASNTWVPITNQRTTPNDPNEGIYIYKFKQHLWSEKSIPTFILNDYKIQVENDFIETYVQLHVTEQKREELTKELENFKGKFKSE